MISPEVMLSMRSNALRKKENWNRKAAMHLLLRVAVTMNGCEI